MIIHFCHSKEGHKSWLQIYNGSDPRWLIIEEIVPPSENYVFRVAAENTIGLGEFSQNSSLFSYSPGNVHVYSNEISIFYIYNYFIGRFSEKLTVD